jgi:hypothetical protein
MRYREIRRAMQAQGIEISERDMYAVIQSLSLKGRPVGATCRRNRPGAYAWSCAADALRAKHALWKRVLEQLRRARACSATVEEWINEQRYLALASGNS